jgi:hypothetical protein
VSIRSVRATTLGTAAGIALVAALYIQEPATILAAAVVLALLVLIASWQPVVVLGLVAATLPLYHEPMEIRSTTLAPSELLLVAATAGTALRAAAAFVPSWRPAFLNLPSIRTGFKRLDTSFGRIAIVGLAVLALIGFALLVTIHDPDARAAGLREWRWTLIQPLIFVACVLPCWPPPISW